ncbi:hypothetical protein DL95DRAFT_520167 [Leptodontidium sp. 2 PMI_412]|nr:hypothetical protein BKA61DRAFT_663967 [Leptodontidium sp. MPI-SDFR-AT-0119]KAH9220168.1 hypothetical protein DL95DRAFT_520167 [Leptodontidium sp. 2 PMI_412]
MRLRSGTTLEQAEASGSEAEETMQDDNYSTQAVWGSPIPTSESPIDRRLSPSPPLGEAGPSNPAPTRPRPGQQSYPEAHHPGTDFLLYDSWRNDSADDFNYEEQTSNSQSPPNYSQSQSDPYNTSNPGSQPPPAAPSPPPNDYGHLAEDYGYENRRQPITPTQASPPMERYTQDQEAWNYEAPISAEQRRQMLTEDIPDLKRDREYDDKMEEDLTKLTEEERRRKRPRRRRGRASSPKDMRDRGRHRDSDRDRRGGGHGSGQAVWSA